MVTATVQRRSGSPTTEEQVRDMLTVVGDDSYDAFLLDDWPRKHEFLFKLGALDIEGVLHNLLAQRGWTEAAGYLSRAFRYHRRHAEIIGPAVPSVPEDGPQRYEVWDLSRAHPELHILPRAQEALEMAGSGRMDLATEVYQELLQVVEWAAARSTAAYRKFLRGTIQLLGNAVNHGLDISMYVHFAFTNHLPRPARSREKVRTIAAINDYLYVYLPGPSRRQEQMAQAGGATVDWEFVDYTKRERRFRCLVCHKELSGDLFNVSRHL
ncbi:hypothetical protein U9M48_016613 [Paspalum notatum var. saurae]|uniref:Uncharacterized protein n=1 Tax=Paspalum notatum var. saurae TaxID=547442 RepID=A0AAQ3WNB7_PASNO